MNDDYDSPWKEAIEVYFREFLEFFFPQAARDIDWARGHEFLDNELRQVVREAENSRRVVDKLARVWLDNPAGDEVWVLTHIEVQGQWEDEFRQRMYTCNYRLFDRFNRRVATLVVLSDNLPHWRPDGFSSSLWGCSLEFRFPVVKLLDYDWDELEASVNPFAVVVMAHLKTQETRGNDEQRYGWKLRLTRRLYERGYSRDDVRKLFHFIDWLMRLPEDLEDSYWTEIREYEEVNVMPYVNIAERTGRREGLQQGLQEGTQQGLQRALLRLLHQRFGAVSEETQARLAGLSVEQLEPLIDLALATTSEQEFSRQIPVMQN